MCFIAECHYCFLFSAWTTNVEYFDDEQPLFISEIVDTFSGLDKILFRLIYVACPISILSGVLCYFLRL